MTCKCGRNKWDNTCACPKPIDWSKPVQLRNGQRVRILCTDGPGWPNGPVLGIVEGSVGVVAWTASGSRGGVGVMDDLENVPPPKNYGYVNVYPHYFYGDNGSLMYASLRKLGVFHTRDDADEAASVGRVGCIRVELSPGKWED